MKTADQFDQIIGICSDVFQIKTKDYGTAWRILRPSSITDQIYIKANRIRSIDNKGKQMVEDDVRSEFIGIVNYAVMALIQLEMGWDDVSLLAPEKAADLHRKYLEEAKRLMEKKNHDYGEAWRNMRVSSFTDIILMRILRIKQIEDNQGKTTASEGLDANYYDIINYGVFALIMIQEDLEQVKNNF